MIISTKVKGDKIKEGSIPLSALSDEVKDKLENAGAGGGGADWNAQEGDAGYIENRTHANIRETKTLTTGDYTLEDGKLTFGHIFNGGDAIRIDRDLIDSGSNNLNNNIKIHGVDHYRSDINEHFFYCVKDIINPSKDKKYPIYFDIDYDNIVGYIKIYEYESEYYLSIITNADQNDTFRVNYEIFKPLDTNYLPNTIIKTTPQTLSYTDKNQALANLGIEEYFIQIKKKCTLHIQYDELSFDSENPNLVTGYSTGLDNLIKDIKSFISNCYYYNEIGQLITEFGKHTCTEIFCNDLSDVDNATHINISFGTSIFGEASFASQCQIQYENDKLLIFYFEI